MKIKYLFILLILQSFDCSRDKLLYEGGLWNLNYLGYDISTYGHYKIYQIPYLERNDFILKVEWIENINDNKTRVFASRLFPELIEFIDNNKIRIKAEEVPSTFHLINHKGENKWLVLWEPTRFEIMNDFQIKGL
ncbi:hypothetical protein MUP95_10330 [bacterium]|nr:hypothetical protein [bacterium]